MTLDSKWVIQYVWANEWAKFPPRGSPGRLHAHFQVHEPGWETTAVTIKSESGDPFGLQPFGGGLDLFGTPPPSVLAALFPDFRIDT